MMANNNNYNNSVTNTTKLKGRGSSGGGSSFRSSLFIAAAAGGGAATKGDKIVSAVATAAKDDVTGSGRGNQNVNSSADGNATPYKSPRRRNHNRTPNNTPVAHSPANKNTGNSTDGRNPYPVETTRPSPSSYRRRRPNPSSSPRNDNRSVAVVSDFAEMRRMCGAVRYQVHRPGCSCRKLRDVSSRIDGGGGGDGRSGLDGLIVLPEIKDVSVLYVCPATDRASFERDPRSCEETLRDALFPPKTVGSYSDTTGDGTVVDGGTADPSVNRPNATTAQPANDDHGRRADNFKVRCAACMLQPEGNGFLCIWSSDRQPVDMDALVAARDAARERAVRKRGRGGLHADHAHYICTFPQGLLRRMLVDGGGGGGDFTGYKGGKSRKSDGGDNTATATATTTDAADTTMKEDDVTQKILNHMMEQGVPISNDTDTINTGSVDNNIGDNDPYPNNTAPNTTISIGHHLKTALKLTRSDHQFNSAHFLTIVYDDTTTTTATTNKNTQPICTPKYTIDLPGGKRRLGESSWEGAVRETEEEMSLVVDRQTWRLGNGGEPLLGRSRSEWGNMYYVLRPPVLPSAGGGVSVDGGEGLGVAGLMESPFWTNTGIG